MDLGQGRRSRVDLDLGQGRRSRVDLETKATDIFVDTREVSENKGFESPEKILKPDTMSASSNEPSDEYPKERVVLDSVGIINETDKKLEHAKTPRDFLNIGIEKGRVEGMIEGYILAMFNNGLDLDTVSRKLILTFNLTKQKSENYLRQFYEKRNINFEEE